jgi:hypothetical protein
VLAVDVDWMVLVVDVNDGLSCWHWTCWQAIGGIVNISINDLLSSDESPSISHFCLSHWQWEKTKMWDYANKNKRNIKQ